MLNWQIYDDHDARQEEAFWFFNDLPRREDFDERSKAIGMARESPSLAELLKSKEPRC